jgi:serine protease AprX
VYDNRLRYNIKVLNLSLGAATPQSYKSSPIDAAVERLWQAGIVVVASAGNYATNGQPSGVVFAPANDPFVVTVGAADLNGTQSSSDDFAAPWSAYGYTYDGFRKPEIGAPGRNMVAAVPTASTLALGRPDRIVAPGYMQLSGTSMAAAVVSGTAAHILAAHPEYTPDQVKGALMASARATSAASLSLGVGELQLVELQLVELELEQLELVEQQLVERELVERELE